MIKPSYFPRGNADHSLPHEPLATTQWTSDEKTIAYFELKAGGVNPFLFGQLEDDAGETKYLAYDDDAGIVTIAGSRAGKGVSLIIPNLLSYKGSVVVLDPKGENAKASAKWRQDTLGQAIQVFDPYDITEFQSASFNPLSVFDHTHKEFIDDITDLADALIVRGNGNDPHWDESARSVIKMILIYIIINCNQSNKHLVSLRQLILNGQSKSEKPNYKPPVFIYDDELSAEENAEIEDEIYWEIEDDKQKSFHRFLQNLAEHDHEYVSGTAKRLLQSGDRERGSILSTVQRNTEFLDSPSIQEVLIGNDFDICDLWASSLFLVLPEKRLAGQARFLRLMLTIILRHIQTHKKPNASDPSMLMVLDECAVLGRMEVIERAAGYIAGFGVKLWTIWQGLSQLQDIYGKQWETFMANASLFTAFGNSDYTTQDYISKRVGHCEISRIEESYTGGTSNSENRAGLGQGMTAPMTLLDAGGSSGESMTHNVKPSTAISRLLHPEEVGRYFGKNTQKILVHFGQGQPVCVDRIIYYEDELFKLRAR